MSLFFPVIIFAVVDIVVEVLISLKLFLMGLVVVNKSSIDTPRGVIVSVILVVVVVVKVNIALFNVVVDHLVFSSGQ